MVQHKTKINNDFHHLLGHNVSISISSIQRSIKYCNYKKLDALLLTVS
jgi:hypothetical protein